MKKYVILFGASLLLFGCSVKQPEMVYNQSASLANPEGMNPLEQTLLTSFVNVHTHTMSTLYGNTIAARYARLQKDGTYPAGTVLFLVTWKQQADARWFGANIPDSVSSVEVVQIRSVSQTPLYHYYSGKPLQLQQSSYSVPNRIRQITHEKISLIP